MPRISKFLLSLGCTGLVLACSEDREPAPTSPRPSHAVTQDEIANCYTKDPTAGQPDQNRPLVRAARAAEEYFADDQDQTRKAAVLQDLATIEALCPAAAQGVPAAQAEIDLAGLDIFKQIAASRHVRATSPAWDGNNFVLQAGADLSNITLLFMQVGLPPNTIPGPNAGGVDRSQLRRVGIYEVRGQFDGVDPTLPWGDTPDDPSKNLNLAPATSLFPTPLVNHAWGIELNTEEPTSWGQTATPKSGPYPATDQGFLILGRPAGFAGSEAPATMAHDSAPNAYELTTIPKQTFSPLAVVFACSAPAGTVIEHVTDDDDGVRSILKFLDSKFCTKDQTSSLLERGLQRQLQLATALGRRLVGRLARFVADALSPAPLYAGGTGGAGSVSPLYVVNPQAVVATFVSPPPSTGIVGQFVSFKFRTTALKGTPWGGVEILVRLLSNKGQATQFCYKTDTQPTVQCVREAILFTKDESHLSNPGELNVEFTSTAVGGMRIELSVNNLTDGSYSTTLTSSPIIWTK